MNSSPVFLQHIVVSLCKSLWLALPAVKGFNIIEFLCFEKNIFKVELPGRSEAPYISAVNRVILG